MKVQGAEREERGNEECYRQREHKVEDPEVRKHSMWELKVVQWGWDMEFKLVK